MESLKMLLIFFMNMAFMVYLFFSQREKEQKASMTTDEFKADFKKSILLVESIQKDIQDFNKRVKDRGF